MTFLISDLRNAFRILSRSPGFTAVTSLSLGLAIGMNTTVFSVINGLFLRPLPVQEPGSLVRIGSTTGGRGFYAFSHPDYCYLRDHNDVFTGILAHQPTSVGFNDGGQAEIAWAELVSGNYFAVLGLDPPVGRAFDVGEDQSPGRDPVLVLSHGFWQRRFGADPSVVGRVVRLNGFPFTVVGVAPRGFNGTFVGFSIDMWVPTMMQAQVMRGRGNLGNRDDRFLMLVGRLRPDANIGKARAAMTTLAVQLEQDYPDTNRGRGVALVRAGGVHPFLAGVIGGFLALLQAIVFLVLMIACTNVAGLLLARASYRRKEIAVRLSLGASVARIVQQLMTECMVLAVLAGGIGFALGEWGVQVLSALRLPTDVPLTLNLKMDTRVFTFNLLISVFTAFLFGLVPALMASSPDLIPALKDEAGTGRYRRSRMRSGLTAAQMAISVVLLVSAGLLWRSVINSRRIDPGFDPRNVIVFSPHLTGYERDRVLTYYDQLQQRLRHLPEVESVGVAGWVPLGDRGDSQEFEIGGLQIEPGRRGPVIGYNLAGPGYLQTLRIPIVRGRDIGPEDRSNSPPVVVVNETLAARYWKGQDPIGKRMKFRAEPIWREVAGVARDARYRSLGEDALPHVYVPYTQYHRFDLTVFVRARSRPDAQFGSIRRESEAVDTGVAISDVKMMSESMDFSLVPLRAAGIVLAISGGLALALAALGIYGIQSYAIAQRVREIGIRMALGARAGHVVSLIVGEAMKLIAIGAAIGLGLSFAATRLLTSFLFGVSTVDPSTYATIVLLLAAVAFLSSLIPARRAAKIDPLSALRHE